MEIFSHNSNVNFLGMRRVSITIAILLMLASIVLIAVRGLNYGLDFSGGVSVEASYGASVVTTDVAKALQAGGIRDAQVQTLGGSKRVTIRFQPKDDANPAALSKGKANLDVIGADVLKALKATRPDVTLTSRSLVSAEVGSELKSDGMVAAVFVIIGIGLYLGIRFEWRFAVAALATEVHDALVTIGIFALTRREFDLTVLASVLAVIGYSINDKVVVFDRIRELFRLARKAEPVEILNRSINNTLSRTIITSLFTAITMAALYFFGGPVVHGFAITMLIGIVIGTLSSIFVASPILLWLGVSKQDLMPKTRDNPELARRP